MNQNKRDYDWIECELAGYRRGFLSVRIDFARGVLIWKDSNRWYNNFVRGLSVQSMDKARNDLAGFIELNKNSQLHEMEDYTPRPFVWHVSAGYADSEEKCMEISGTDIEMESWQLLSEQIAELGHRSFRL